MTGKPAHPRDLAKDLRTLRDRGLTMTQAAAELGMSRSTAYRILAEASSHRYHATWPRPRRKRATS